MENVISVKLSGFSIYRPSLRRNEGEKQNQFSKVLKYTCTGKYFVSVQSLHLGESFSLERFDCSCARTEA
jgi:hypothetical protein